MRIPSNLIVTVRALTGKPLFRQPSWWLAQFTLLALAAYVLSDVIVCLGSCFVDIAAIRGHRAELQVIDIRLNSWILAWVQHAIFEEPGALLDGNAFYPASRTLTGSEHLLGVSLLLLPLRVFHPSAVALHQAATVLSFLILAWTTFGLVYWLTRSIWAAFIAAATTMFMPWRLSELVHIQLLSVHWVPLIWLLFGKIAIGEAQRSSAPLLALILLLQLLSSYYLAYFTTASIAVLAVVLTLRHGIRRATVLPWVAALTVAYATFVLVSLPYLQREKASDLVLRLEPVLTSNAIHVLSGLAPRFDLVGPHIPWGTYYIPFCVALLALLGVLLAPLVGRSDAAADARLRSYSFALWSIVAMALVLSLGHYTVFQGTRWPLPGLWASDWIPGYQHLRAPVRWAILIGLLGPVLAGIGVSRCERVLDRWHTAPGVTKLRWGLRITVFALVALNMPWRPLPVVAAMPQDHRDQGYEFLRSLPAGPVLEIPWPLGRMWEIDSGSRQMLASTLHWKPILNGFTAYRPRTYEYLHRIGSYLPSEDALRKLNWLTGLRWIVVHPRGFWPSKRREWQRLVDAGTLRKVYDDEYFWILELVDRDGSGVWLDAMKSTVPRSRTFAGISRDPLHIPTGSSRLDVKVPEGLRTRAQFRRPAKVNVSLWNGTLRPWPGFDIQTEGLVEVRYRFLRGDESIAYEGRIHLDADVAALSSLVGDYYLWTPVKSGVYVLRFDVVQRVGGSLAVLPVQSVERRISVQ